MQGKLNTVGMIWQILGVLSILAGVACMAYFTMAGRAAGGAENGMTGAGIGAGIGVVVLVICAVFGLLEFFAGGALKKNKGWARITLIVLSSAQPAELSNRNGDRHLHSDRSAERGSKDGRLDLILL